MVTAFDLCMMISVCIAKKTCNCCICHEINATKIKRYSTEIGKGIQHKIPIKNEETLLNVSINRLQTGLICQEGDSRPLLILITYTGTCKHVEYEE